MPIVSKYSNDQIESLVNELLMVIEQHKTPTDLALLAVGNLTTHLLQERLPAAQRQAIAESFASALVQSVKPAARH